MCKNSIYTMISELLSDTNELARISAMIRGTQIKSRYIDQFSYPIGGSIIELKRDPTKSLREYFATVFIKNLYLDNEWKRDALDEMSTAEWESYLKDLWIPQYFDYSSFKRLKQYTSKDAIKMIIDYLLDGGLSQSEYELLNKRYEDMEVVMINKGCCDYVFVGANDGYFI